MAFELGWGENYDQPSCSRTRTRTRQGTKLTSGGSLLLEHLLLVCLGVSDLDIVLLVCWSGGDGRVVEWFEENLVLDCLMGSSHVVHEVKQLCWLASEAILWEIHMYRAKRLTLAMTVAKANPEAAVLFSK